MRTKGIILISFFALFACLFVKIDANAMNTGFSTEELSEEQKTTFLSNIGLSTIITEPNKKSILCFDANEHGMIAVGTKGSRNGRKEVYVYTTEGDFLYGYAFNCAQSFAVEWDEQLLNIFFVRSDIIISLDQNGNVLDIKSVQDTINNNSHTNLLLYSTERKVGNASYIMRNDMGPLNWLTFSYSQIVAVDSAGTENVIYDVNSMQLTKTIVGIVFISIFVFIIILGIAREFIKAKRNKKNETF